MDHLEALLPPPPFDSGVMLPRPIAPPSNSSGCPNEPSEARSDRAQESTGCSNEASRPRSDRAQESHLSPAHLAALYTELSDLRRDCLQLARRARELPFTILGHNEIRAINARLETVRAVNRTLHPWHRSASVTGWPTPPIPTTTLMCPPDLIPWLTDALAVLAARQTWPLQPTAEAADALMPSPSHHG